MAFHAVVNRLCQECHQSSNHRLKNESKHDLLNAARFLAAYYSNRPLYLPRNHDSILPNPFEKHNGKESVIVLDRVHCSLQPFVQPADSMVLYMAAGMSTEAVQMSLHCADLRSLITVQAGVNQVQPSTIPTELQFWFDQRLLAGLFTRVSDLSTAGAAAQFISTDFDYFLRTFIKIDTFCGTELVELIEQRFVSSLKRHGRVFGAEADDDVDSTIFPYILCQQPAKQPGHGDGDADALDSCALLVNLLLKLLSVSNRLQNCLDQLLPELLRQAAGTLRGAHLTPLTDWLVPLVLELNLEVPQGDSVEYLDSTFLEVLNAAVLINNDDDEINLNDSNCLIALLLNCHQSLATFVHYCHDRYLNDRPHDQNHSWSKNIIWRRQNLESWKNWFLINSGVCDKSTSTLMHHVNQLDLSMCQKLLDTDGLVSIKLELNIDQLADLMDDHFDPDDHSEIISEPEVIIDKTEKPQNDPMQTDNEITSGAELLESIDIRDQTVGTIALVRIDDRQSIPKPIERTAHVSMASANVDIEVPNAPIIGHHQDHVPSAVNNSIAKPVAKHNETSPVALNDCVPVQISEQVVSSSPAIIRKGFVDMDWRPKAGQLIDSYMRTINARLNYSFNRYDYD